jgi:hypothetical protein
MHTAMLKRMVRRIEERAGSSGPCPYCAGRRHVPLREGQVRPVCAVCQRPLPACRIVKIDDFYGNAARLAALQQGEED